MRIMRRDSTFGRIVGDVRHICIFSGWEDGLSMIVVLQAKTVTIRRAGGAASYYCQGKRKTKYL